MGTSAKRRGFLLYIDSTDDYMLVILKSNEQ